MKRTFSQKALFGFMAVILGVAVFAPSAFAQVEQPSQISIQGTGLVTRTLDDQIPSHEATKSGGLLVGYSYQFSKWFGVEGNYGYTRNTQKFVSVGGPTSLESDFHEATGAFVVHIPSGNRSIQPYVLGGGGTVTFDPTDRYSVSGSERQTRGTFVYGGGANFRITNLVGIRAEYRGLVYKAPDFGLPELNLDKFTHLAQPSVGLVFRF